MDIIERHFAAENARDVSATLATYSDDLVWDDVGNPDCPVYGKSAAAEMYEGIIDAIPDLHLESVGRFACGDHVVDESIVTGHIVGSFIGIQGGGAPVRFRMLHVFDIRDGLISREQAWFDTAGVIRQVDSHRNGATDPISR
ncbi:MAG: nuclear transport factor 2 family protein [Actinobacteria bacterium]|nr:nuclear transport factor 2 family protein [Actinomycetota bacterium]